VRLGDAAAQIVWHQDLRGPAEKSEAARVRAQPVGQLLRPGGFGEGVAGSPEDGDEDLRLADLAGVPVDDRYGLAGVVDEQFFSGAMLLAHDDVDLGGPEPVVLAEPAVLVALWMGQAIFLPEQGQGDAGATHLSVSQRPVGHWTLITGNRRRWREQMPLQFSVRQFRWPSQPAGVEAMQIITGTAAADAKASGDLAHGQAGVEL